MDNAEKTLADIKTDGCRQGRQGRQGRSDPSSSRQQKQTLRVFDIFSGVGGFSLGLERAGMRTVAFCEIDPFCRAVLKKHWPDVPCYDDITTLTAARLAADGIIATDERRSVADAELRHEHQEKQILTRRQGPRLFSGIDAICGGFPCQDISVAGKGAGIEGGRSGLWSEYARIIGEVRPRYVIVENVADLLIRGIERVLGDLAALGYDAWWSCLRACDLGAPHIRDRIWIVAYPKGSKKGRTAAANCHREFEKARANQGSQAGRRVGNFGGKNWNPEPRICRVDDGIRVNVDRISALGNSVIPQIPEIIGRAIMGTRTITGPMSKQDQQNQVHIIGGGLAGSDTAPSYLIDLYRVEGMERP